MNRKVFDWTPERDMQLVVCWRDRFSQDEIATLFHTTKNTIAGRISRLRARGVDLPRRAGGNPALKQKRIAKARKKDSPPVHRDIRKAHRKRRTSTDTHRQAKVKSLPKKDEKHVTYLNNKPEPPDHRTDIHTMRRGSSANPTKTLIPEVEGTTCTTLLMDLKPRQCRYVHGFDDGKRFCDGQAKVGSSFCELHHAMCYRTMAKRQFDKITAPVSP
jgi:hypothetical protein